MSTFRFEALTFAVRAQVWRRSRQLACRGSERNIYKQRRVEN